MKRFRNRQTFLWVLIVLLFLLLVVISVIVFMYQDKDEGSKVENTELISEKRVTEGTEINEDAHNYIIKDNSVGGIAIGDKISEIKEKYKKVWNLCEISIGPEEYDKIYLFKDNGIPELSVIADVNGRVNTIFVFSSKYVTRLKFKVGDSFRKLIETVSEKDMRFGDLSDGINEVGSAEMFRSDGVVYLHYVEENSQEMIADYDYETNTFKIKKTIPDVHIDAIMVSASIW